MSLSAMEERDKCEGQADNEMSGRLERTSTLPRSDHCVICAFFSHWVKGWQARCLVDPGVTFG
jgi:hypothetical protein